MLGMYKSKGLWRGPESIYTLKHGQCVADDSFSDSHSHNLNYQDFHDYGKYYNKVIKSSSKHSNWS